MKKTILFIIVVIMIASLVIASGPPLRIVRLTVINKSGNDVYIKLSGSDLGNQFYYFTIPGGTKSYPVVRTFDVIEDVYTRATTYGEGKYDQCVGLTTTGTLVMDKNVRLTFTPCAYNPPTRVIERCGPILGKKCETRKVPNFGEPTMEKVFAANWLNLQYIPGGLNMEEWQTFNSLPDERLNVNWKRGCGFDTYLFWYVAPVRFPGLGLCRWRYLYDKTPDEVIQENIPINVPGILIRNK